MAQMFADGNPEFVTAHVSITSALICAIYRQKQLNSEMSAIERTSEEDPQTYAIIGACMAVHSELGAGFLEAVYQEALAIEFTLRNIPFVREKPLAIFYSGQQLATCYDADFICYDSIIVELKALSDLIPKHHAQVINYLKATHLERGLLVNFGSTRLEYKRFVLTHSRRDLSADGADIRR